MWWIKKFPDSTTIRDKITGPNITIARNALQLQKDITCIYTKHQENMTFAYYV